MVRAPGRHGTLGLTQKFDSLEAAIILEALEPESRQRPMLKRLLVPDATALGAHPITLE
jgi:hypothetical protein